MLIGTNDAFGLQLRAGGVGGLTISPPVSGIAANLIGGTAYSYTAGSKGIVIAGGGAPLNSDPDVFNEGPHSITDSYATIGGGSNNAVGNGNVDVNDAPFGTVAGGNCYACHQLELAEVSYGTLGPSLTNYGKDRKYDPEEAKNAYTKIYNSQAVVPCSNMPRFGANKVLTE